MAVRKHVTLFDICKKAGVSSATVSRVINNSPLVQEQTRKKVLKTIQDLGYRPSHAARMLARQRTDTLGVIFPDIAGGFYAEVLTGIDRVATESHFHMLTAFSHGRKDAQTVMTRFAEERRVDAAIFMNLSPQTDSFLRGLGKAGLPTVLLHRPVAGLPTVTFDNVGGARQAVDHLVRMGHRRIAFLQGPPENYDAVLREEGMNQALRAAGLEQPAALRWAGDYSEESGNAAVVAFLKTGAPLPDAIFACNDSMAIGALVALQERGLRVPDDVALVGFDDIASARHLGLTSVRIPMRDLGRAAAELAIALSQGQKPKKELIEMPTEVVVRRSCGAGRVRPA